MFLFFTLTKFTMRVPPPPAAVTIIKKYNMIFELLYSSTSKTTVLFIFFLNWNFLRFHNYYFLTQIWTATSEYLKIHQRVKTHLHPFYKTHKENLCLEHLHQRPPCRKSSPPCRKTPLILDLSKTLIVSCMQQN